MNLICFLALLGLIMIGFAFLYGIRTRRYRRYISRRSNLGGFYDGKPWYIDTPASNIPVFVSVGSGDPVRARLEIVQEQPKWNPTIVPIEYEPRRAVDVLFNPPKFPGNSPLREGWGELKPLDKDWKPE